MEVRRRRRVTERGRARLVLLSAGIWFVAAQAGLLGLVEHWDPFLRDPQYGSRLALLRRRLAEAPGRPLVLFMGTSRTLNGVRPSLLPAGPVVAFNFGQAASGPLRQVLTLRRLLREGIRPAHVYLEVLPAQCCAGGEAEILLDQRWPGLDDWPALRHYWPASHSRWRWWRERLLPCVGLRDRLLGRLLPCVVPNWARPWRTDALVTEDDGYFGYGNDLSGEALVRWQARVRASAAPHLRAFRIDAEADRALRHFLSLCRKEHLPVTLLLLPEGSVCRGWYSPLALARLVSYLDGLREQFGVEVVDARRWVGDDGFSDSVHLLPRGANVFTRRFGREVYLSRQGDRQVRAKEPCTRTDPAGRGLLEFGRVAAGAGPEPPCYRP